MVGVYREPMGGLGIGNLNTTPICYMLVPDGHIGAQFIISSILVKDLCRNGLPHMQYS